MPSSSDDSSKSSKSRGHTPPDPTVRVKERDTAKLPTRCDFPGQVDAGVRVPLRVAMERQAYADVSAHAAASLDAEICGVLAGTLCEDDAGPFLQIKAAVRGEASRRGSTHVTFTHETWDVIHKTMEREHPK